MSAEEQHEEDLDDSSENSEEIEEGDDGDKLMEDNGSDEEDSSPPAVFSMDDDEDQAVLPVDKSGVRTLFLYIHFDALAYELTMAVIAFTSELRPLLTLMARLSLLLAKTSTLQKHPHLSCYSIEMRYGSITRDHE
jgi:hypothetical protein